MNVVSVRNELIRLRRGRGLSAGAVLRTRPAELPRLNCVLDEQRRSPETSPARIVADVIECAIKVFPGARTRALLAYTFRVRVTPPIPADVLEMDQLGDRMTRWGHVEGGNCKEKNATDRSTSAVVDLAHFLIDERVSPCRHTQPEDEFAVDCRIGTTRYIATGDVADLVDLLERIFDSSDDVERLTEIENLQGRISQHRALGHPHNQRTDTTGVLEAAVEFATEEAALWGLKGLGALFRRALPESHPDQRQLHMLVLDGVLGENGEWGRSKYSQSRIQVLSLIHISEPTRR